MNSSENILQLFVYIYSKNICFYYQLINFSMIIFYTNHTFIIAKSYHIEVKWINILFI